MKKLICKNGHNKLKVGVFKPAQCKQCNRDRKRKYRKLYPEKRKQERQRYFEKHPKVYSYELQKKHHLKREYQLTMEQYMKLLEKQEGCCAICKRHQSELTKALAVDHSHNTNTIRGLLCTKCNLGLGYFNDNLELLDSATNYLLQFSKIGC